MRVQEVMTDNVRTVPPAMPAEQARSLMKTDKIHHLADRPGRQERHTLNYKTAHRGKKASTGLW